MQIPIGFSNCKFSFPKKRVFKIKTPNTVSDSFKRTNFKNQIGISGIHEQKMYSLEERTSDNKAANYSYTKTTGPSVAQGLLHKAGYTWLIDHAIYFSRLVTQGRLHMADSSRYIFLKACYTGEKKWG